MPEIISRADAMRAGLKRFFTGKPCKHGHLVERYVAGGGVDCGVCVECASTRTRKYYTPEKKEKRKAYDAARDPALTARKAKRENDLNLRLRAVAAGLKTYFTILPCRLGHGERYVNKRAQCAECVRQNSLKKYWKDPEKPRTYSANYRVRNHDKVKATQREWSKKYPDRARAAKLRSNFGITPAQWDEIFTRQGSCCAICKATESNHKSDWHTDHCHTSGKVRGVLCHHCNTGLGLSRDSIPILKSMIAYLERHAPSSCAADPPASGFQDPEMGRAHQVGGPFVCLAIQ